MNVTFKKMKVAALIADRFGSRKAMVEYMGLSPVYLRAMLAAEYCNIRNAVRIAKALDVNVQDIIHENIDE